MYNDIAHIVGRAANPANPIECLWPATALKYIPPTTPVFVVQEFPSVWDTQCQFDGSPYSGILQVSCSDHSQPLYDCAQYSDLCQKTIIENFFLPVQKAYVAETTASGLPTRPGSGGFFHGCYLGAYFWGNHAKNYTECYPPPCNGTRVVTPLDGIWNVLEVGGVSMQAAISKWWNVGDVDKDEEGGGDSLWHVDSYWDPNGLPPTRADGGAAAPWSSSMARSKVTRRRGPPPVPWWVSRYMTNPSCRGYP